MDANFKEIWGTGGCLGRRINREMKIFGSLLEEEKGGIK